MQHIHKKSCFVSMLTYDLEKCTRTKWININKSSSKERFSEENEKCKSFQSSRLHYFVVTEEYYKTLNYESHAFC